MNLTEAQMFEVRQAVRRYIDKAGEIYKRTFPIPVVRFDLRGAVGGKAGYSEWVIRVNPVLCSENFEDYIKQTIGHEVAHLIAHALYKGLKISPHGTHWKGVMYRFGLSADRCHQYDTSNTKVRETTKYEYSCNCQVHKVGPAVHNKMSVQSRTYHCRKCKSTLKPGTQIGGSPHKTPTVRHPGWKDERLDYLTR